MLLLVSVSYRLHSNNSEVFKNFRNFKYRLDKEELITLCRFIVIALKSISVARLCNIQTNLA